MYGFSRSTGVWPIVVKDGFGKCCAGAFAVPTNTMFHTLPTQLPHVSLRDIHCCCEPELTWPLIRESARKPPLEKPSPVGSSFRLPRMSTRRIDAPCDTAHVSVPLLGVIA